VRSIESGFCGVIAIRQSYSCREVTTRKNVFFLSLFKGGMEARDSSIYTYKSWLARFSFWIAREARENEQRDVFHRTGRHPFVFFSFFIPFWCSFFSLTLPLSSSIGATRNVCVLFERPNPSSCPLQHARHCLSPTARYLSYFFFLFILPVKRATAFSPSLSFTPFLFYFGKKILICQSHTTVVGIASMTGDYITGCVMAMEK
jgi:hypothetical protein